MLEVKKLSKTFRLYKKPSDRLQEIFLKRKKHVDHVALSNITFQLRSGESLGVIGPNGAGKSTLLKILTGVLLPDSGEINTKGKIAGLIELGTGFNFEISGLENLKNNALLMGMSKKEITSKLNQIIDFAEIGSFIHEPLKTYSSGMVMRLAFSTAIHTEPHCFVVDEALSVGDAYFQQKCIRKIMEFKKNGGSLLFVSHDLNAIKLLCSNVLVLDRGKVVGIESAEKAVNLYNKIISNQKNFQTDVSDRLNSKGFGTFRAEILSVNLNGLKEKDSKFISGEKINLKIEIRSFEKVEDLVVGFMIRDKFGQDIFGTNSHLHDIQLSSNTNQLFDVDWTFDLNIGVGNYTLSVALHRGPDHTVECLHWKDSAIQFEVLGVSGNVFAGICRLEPKFNINYK